MIYDVSDIQLENSVYLHPSVVPAETVKNVQSQFFVYISKGLIFPLRENPYLSSELFHTIAGNQEHSISKGLFLPQ